MENNAIWKIAVGVLMLTMLFCNRKVRLLAVIIEQIKVFKNAKNEKISFWDCFCFLVSPWIISYICTYKLDFIVERELAELLSTVFSIVFTVLFGFAAVMVSKIDSGNKKEKQVAEETFVSIVSANLMSLITAILSIALTQIDIDRIVKIVSFGVVGSSLMIVMLILLITKRTFFLYVNNK